MTKTFLIKDRSGKKLGEIIYLKREFRVNVLFEEVKEELEKLLKKFSREGISNLGEIILDKPIKAGDPLFLKEIQNQLAKKGYILIEK